MIAGPAPAGGSAVLVRDDSGLVVAQAALPADRTFALTYRHSVHGVPAMERFVAEPGERFRMVGVSSPSEAVLDYYGVDGTRRRDAKGWHLDLATPPSFTELPLIATKTGRRTLVVGPRRMQLFAPGAGTHLTLAVEH